MSRALPLSLLVLVVLSLLALPFQNTITRRMEREADWGALKLTRDPASATGLFEGFTVNALAEPDPPTWEYVLMEDHPTIVQRVALVRAWEQHGRPGP